MGTPRAFDVPPAEGDGQGGECDHWVLFAAEAAGVAGERPAVEREA